MNSPRGNDLSQDSLELLAAAAYGQGDSVANQKLKGWASQLHAFPQATTLLINSSNPYAQVLAGNALISLVPRYWNRLAVQDILSLRQNILEKLSRHVSELPDFVRQILIRLFCRITKVGLNRDERFAQFCRDLAPLLDSCVEQKVLGLMILQEIIGEVVETDSKCFQSPDEHSQILFLFKKRFLLEIFQLSMNMLIDCLSQRASNQLLAQCIELSRRCLTFKWYGVNTDETKEYLSSIRLPEEWKEQLSDSRTLGTWLNLLKDESLDVECTAKVLEIVAQLAGCRQTLFSESSLQQHVLVLVQHTSEIAQNHSHRLKGDESCYIQFARVLLAIKSTYRLDQLGDLSGNVYQQWVQSVTCFTQDCMNASNQVGGTIHYLLNLWAQFAHSIGYSQAKYVEAIENVVPHVLSAYVQTRVELLHALVGQGDPEEFFQDHVLEQNFHQLPVLARKSFSAFVQGVCGRLEELQTSFKNCDLSQLPFIEGELAWWVKVVGVVIQDYGSNQRNGPLDAQLLVTVFSICESVRKFNKPQTMCTGFLSRSLAVTLNVFLSHLLVLCKLPSALQSFYDHLAPSLAPNSSSEASQASQSRFVHQLFLHPTLSHLLFEFSRTRIDQFSVLEPLLQLLVQISSQSALYTLLLEIEAASLLLISTPSFPFLSQSQDTSHLPESITQQTLTFRSEFYFFWGVVVFSGARNTIIESLQNTFHEKLQALAQPNVSGQLVHALLHDFKGIIKSTSKVNDALAYYTLYQWFSSNGGFDLLTRLVQMYGQSPSIACSILGVFEELVYNDEFRIRFPAYSPEGLCLFKHSSNFLHSFIQSSKGISVTPDTLYTHKLKPLHSAMKILEYNFSGDYVPFGAFVFYQDPDFAQGLIGVMERIVSIPFEELMAHEDMRRGYFRMMSSVITFFPSLLSHLPDQEIQFVIHSLCKGVLQHDLDTAEISASTLELWMTYLSAEASDSDNLLKGSHASTFKQMFVQVLIGSFQKSFFDDQDSLKYIGPLFVVTLFWHRDVFAAFQSQIMTGQSSDAQGVFSEKLLELYAVIDKESKLTSPDVKAKTLRSFYSFRRTVQPFFVNL